VKAFARVLLEVNAFDPHDDVAAVFQVDGNRTFANNRRFVLADLIALRQIRVEIILPVKNRSQIHLRFQSKSRANYLTHAFLIDHRQHSGHRGIDQRYVRIRRATEFG